GRKLGWNDAHFPHPAVLCQAVALAVEDQTPNRFFNLPLGGGVGGCFFIVIAAQDLHIPKAGDKRGESGGDRPFHQEHPARQEDLVGSPPLPATGAALLSLTWRVVRNTLLALKHSELLLGAEPESPRGRPVAR